MSKRLGFHALTVLVLISSMLAGGCAYRSQVEEQKTTIEQLQEQNESQSDTIEDLEGTIEQKESRITELNDEIASLESSLTEAQEEIDRLEARSDSQTERIESLKERRSSLQDTLDERSQKIDTLEEELESLRTQRENRLASLREENQTLEDKLSEVKDASARQEGQNVVIRVDSRILFDLGQHELKSSSTETLDQVASILDDYEDRPVAIEGHTDTVPVMSGSQFPSNWHLSAARAVSVVQYLTGEYGLNPKRFRAVGFGEYDPIRPNTSEENRRLNRRVEIVLYPPERETKSVAPGE